MSCDQGSCTNFQTFFSESRPDTWTENDKIENLCIYFAELPEVSAVVIIVFLSLIYRAQNQLL